MAFSIRNIFRRDGEEPLAASHEGAKNGEPTSPFITARSATPSQVEEGFSVRELSILIPPQFVKQNGLPGDQIVPLKLDHLQATFATGRPSLKLSEIQAIVPELFSRPILPAEDVEVVLPYQKVRRIIDAHISRNGSGATATGRATASLQQRAQSPFVIAQERGSVLSPEEQAAPDKPRAAEGSPFGVSKSTGPLPGSPIPGLTPMGPPAELSPTRPMKTKAESPFGLAQVAPPPGVGVENAASPFALAGAPAPKSSGPLPEKSPFTPLGPAENSPKPPQEKSPFTPLGEPRRTTSLDQSPFTPVVPAPIAKDGSPFTPISESPHSTPEKSPFTPVPLEPPKASERSPFKLRGLDKTMPVPLVEPDASPFAIAPNTGTQENSPFAPVAAPPGPSRPVAPPETPDPPKAMERTDQPSPASAAGENTPAARPTQNSQQARPTGSLAAGEIVSLGLRQVLANVPPEILGFNPSIVPEAVKVDFPLTLIKPQLSAGKVCVKIKDIAQGVLERFRPAFSSAPQEFTVMLPFSEVFHNLPQGSVPGIPPERPEPESGPKFLTPFSAKAAEDARIPAPQPNAPVMPMVGDSPKATPAATAAPELPALLVNRPKSGPAKLPDPAVTGTVSVPGLPGFGLPTQAPAPQPAAPIHFPPPPPGLISNQDLGTPQSAANLGDNPPPHFQPRQPLPPTPAENRTPFTPVAAAPAPKAAPESPALPASVIPPLLQKQMALRAAEQQQNQAPPTPPTAKQFADDPPFVQPARQATAPTVAAPGTSRSFLAPLTGTLGDSPPAVPTPVPPAHEAKPEIGSPQDQVGPPPNSTPASTLESPLALPTPEAVQTPTPVSEPMKVQPPPPAPEPPPAPVAIPKTPPTTPAAPRQDLGLGYAGVPDQLAIRALFQVDEPLSAERILQLCAELDGIRGCVGLFPSASVSRARPGEEPNLESFSQSARLSLGYLTGLAETLGVPRDGTFTLRTDAGVRTFFLENGFCLAVLHQEPSFPRGVREKLILVTRELAKMAA